MRRSRSERQRGPRDSLNPPLKPLRDSASPCRYPRLAEPSRSCLSKTAIPARAAVAEALASSEAAERGRAPVEAARSRIIAGRALVAAGDRAAGKSALESAHSQLLSHGARRYSDEAAQELRKLGAAVPRSARRRQGGSNVLGLTDRELEVMELVAAGETNREIADGLFLSVRTVDRHLARIFDKLDVKSRAAASSAFERARSRLSPRSS